MHRITIAIAALVAAEGAAMACVCVPVTDQEQKREFARRIVSEAVAVAEVVRLDETTKEPNQPEMFRVLQVHAGSAPETFRLPRQTELWPGGEVVTLATSCDVVPEVGKRTLVALYPPSDSNSDADCSEAAKESSPKSLAIGGTCVHLFLQSEGALELIREEARKRQQ